MLFPQSKTLFIVVSILSTTSAFSESVPFIEAVERALEAAQVSNLQQAARDKAQGHRQAASSLPNPSFFYEREALGGSASDDDARESTFGVSAPLDFIWKRRARIQAAERRAEIDTYRIEAETWAIRQRIAAIYVEFAAATFESERHEVAHEALDRARRIAVSTTSAGDAPPTLLRRVDLAIARHAFEEADVQSRLMEIRSRFASMLGAQEAAPEIKRADIAAPAFPDRQAAQEAALTKRPELKAAAAFHYWKKADEITARREGLPDASLEAGHKEDGSGRDGSYFGLSVEIPLFERNQAAKRIARAESIQADIAHERARREISGAAAAAFLRWERLSKDWLRLTQNLQASSNAEQLLRSIEASFAAGEASLLEHLDTVEAFLETAHNEIELQKALRLAAVDLAFVTATDPIF